MRHALLVLSLLVAAVPFAHADVVDIVWSPEGSFSHKGTIAAGQFVELCGKLPADKTFSWDFDVSQPVDFNVHYHEGKDVVFPAKLSAVKTARDTLNTKIQQDYCWMWSNTSTAPATLSVNLRR